MKFLRHLTLHLLALLAAGPVIANSRNSDHLLGPTGMLGKTDKRGITITKVEAGSPADGKIRPGDVIAGAESTIKLHPDARRRLAAAIDEAETGNNKHLEEIRNTVGKHTRLITCLADWNNADPGAVIPDARAKGIGLYGFCMPASKDGTIPLKGFISRQVTELRSDERNISALARAFHGKSLDADWNGQTFAEPATPYALRLGFATSRRGLSATGRRTTEGDTTLVTIETPYHHGEGTLTRVQPQWTDVRIRLQRSKMAPNTIAVRMTNGTRACEFALQKDAPITWGTTESLATGKGWKFTSQEGDGRPSEMRAIVEKTPEFIEFFLPKALLDGNPEVIAYEWLNE